MEKLLSRISVILAQNARNPAGFLRSFGHGPKSLFIKIYHFRDTYAQGFWFPALGSVERAFLSYR